MSLFGSIGVETWMADAKCVEIPVMDADDLLFPDNPNSNGPGKRVCNGRPHPTQPGVRIGECPVRAQCLELALRQQERFGVWGGKSPRQRQAIAAQRAALEAG